MAAITFHGGMRSITYEWGDTFNNRLHSTAPDHFAMKSIAEKMNVYSGKSYLVGTSSDVVYAVRGGMEEWGYAGTWFNKENAVTTVPSVCGEKHEVKMSNVSNRCSHMVRSLLCRKFRLLHIYLLLVPQHLL